MDHSDTNGVSRKTPEVNNNNNNTIKSGNDPKSYKLFIPRL